MESMNDANDKQRTQQAKNRVEGRMQDREILEQEPTQRLLAVALLCDQYGLNAGQANELYTICEEHDLDIMDVIDGKLSVDDVLAAGRRTRSMN